MIHSNNANIRAGRAREHAEAVVRECMSMNILRYRCMNKLWKRCMNN